MADSKWNVDLSAGTPVREAARSVISATLRSVARRLQRAAGPRGSARAVHALRVATRRAEAALDLFEPYLDAKALEKCRRRLKRVRRAAASAREADVHLAEIGRWLRHAGRPHAPALRFLADRVGRERREARRRIEETCRRYPGRRWKRAAARLLGPVDERASVAETLLDAARRSIAERREEFAAAAANDLHDLAQVHRLRLAVKRLRYDLELVAACLHAASAAGAGERVQRLQDRLGRLNDRRVEVDRLTRLIADLEAGGRSEPAAGRSSGRPSATLSRALRRIAEISRDRRDRAHRRFLAFWAGAGAAELAADLGSLFPADASLGPRPVAASSGTTATAADVAASNGRLRAVAMEGNSEEAEPSGAESVRFAAIDVGTNSIRLIVAEARPDGSYRVLDDEKEIARLGRGLDATGVLEPGSMESAATAVARMRAIAEGYGVRGDGLVAVGTCAVREAANRDEFVELVRRRAGIDLRVITAEEEARLAFLSASNALDLSDGTAAVVDVGGGSTEIVLSARGAVDRIYTIPLGAVRLTERFGGPEACATERYREMRRQIRRTLRDRVGRPPAVPRLLVGTGGTVTTLACMAIHAELGPAADGLFAGSIQGRQVRRWEVKHLLDRLRELPVRERARVEGLSPDRADIIVAGLALVDGVMKHLGVDSICAHDGGIRDGLLLSMVRRRLGAAEQEGAAGRDPMRSIRRFARACGYEHRHCTHVTALALRIFDDLAADPRTPRRDRLTPAARALLEAAALVHDVGYVVNYSGHHRHSYHLIVHGDLPGWSARDVEIIANVARYHRRAEPKPSHGNFARLSREDQALVRILAAILRVADGLDRTHMQRVAAVRATIEDGAVRFAVEAPEEPTVDIWGAARKCDLFREVFGLEPRFEWVPLGPPPAAESPVVVVHRSPVPA
jgi:exopolyphosphatase/guanosine-5'-triphosphate,3'-diphosphate pyrophosphatase